MQLLDMPSELLLLIGEELSAKDLTAFTKTSRAVHSLLTPQLYNLGARPSEKGDFPTLYWAAQHGHETLVRGLLAKGASPNGPKYRCELFGCVGSHRSTALHWATKSDNTRVIKTLLEHGGDVNAKDNHNATPVHWACGNSGTEVLALLLQEKPDLEAKDGDGDPPIAWAAEKGIPEVFEFMLDHGADIAAINNSRATLMHTVFLRADLYVSTHAEIVRIMMDRGFGLIEQRDDRGNMALHLAARCGSVEAVKVMLQYVDVDALGSDDQTALYQASEVGAVKMVKYLLKAHARVNLRNGSQGGTALHAAAKGGHHDVMKVLIGAGADVEAVKSPKETPLHIAIVEGRSFKSVKLLLKSGADANAKQGQSGSPLHLAAAAEGGIVRLLLEHGAKVDARMANGSTALMIAAERGCDDAVEVLLEYGADVRAKDRNGSKAWNRAHDEGNFRTKSILEKMMEVWPVKKPGAGEDEDVASEGGSPTPEWGLEKFFGDLTIEEIPPVEL